MAISEYLRRLRDKIGTELVVVPCVTAIIRDPQGRLLLAHHAERGVWGTPGGAVDPGESPATAIARELLEETGLEVEALRVLGAYGGPEFLVTYPNGDQCSYVMIAFECAITGGEMQPDGEEVTELRWVTEAELMGLNLSTWGRRWLPEILRLA